jgi:hypothetical protein
MRLVVNAAHQIDLVASLTCIILIDAYFIDPDVSTAKALSDTY